MNKVTKNIAALIAFGIGTTTISFAQVTQQKIGNKPTIISPSAVLEVESTNKGVLLPRVALASLTDAATINNPEDALTVFNTATAGSTPNNVTPGYYYWKKDLVTPANSKWVRIIDQTSVTEPWQVQGGSVQATANTQNIYQTGSVAVGDFSTAASTKKMEVKGDFKAEIAVPGGVVGTEVGSPQNPNGAMHYWSNGTDYRTASANDISATLEAKTGTTTNTFAAGSTQAQMASQNGTNSLSTVRTLNTGEFRLESYNVANNFGSTVSLQNDGLRLRHTNTNGALDPFPANNLTEILVRKAEGVQFSYQNAAGNSLSAYWFPITTGAAGQVMTQTATGKMVWTSPSTFGAANNGLTKNATTGVFELGGDLNRATTIATTISGTTYPLNITGLPSVASTTAPVMIVDGGQLKMINPSNLIQEPWKVIGSAAPGTPATLNTENIYQMGNVAIGATTAPSFLVGATTVQPKLHIAGDVSTTGKYYTTNSVYADYVFEKYFKGSSDINPNYEFKSLNYVKDFIKANHHLPGVESIDELSKAENGYTFDMTKLTVQSLEKIEELYIHTIEQQDKIDQQQSEINKLKKEAEEIGNRLDRLEKLLLKDEK